MKERMPFALDFDTLKSEATRASMHVEQMNEGVEVNATEIVMVASNYTHPISVVGQLLVLIQKTLKTDSFWFIRSTEQPYDKSSTRICVVVSPRNKE